MESVNRTWFSIGGCSGVVGAKRDSKKKVVFKDLSDVALCSLNRQVLRSDGLF